MHDNPILNAPYTEPRWHYATDLQGHLNYEDIRPGRRIFDPTQGGYTIPVKRQVQGSILILYRPDGSHLMLKITSANKQCIMDKYWVLRVNAIFNIYSELRTAVLIN